MTKDIPIRGVSTHVSPPNTPRRTAAPQQVAAELVRLARRGDAAAFGELVRRYRERIFALVLHLTGNESDADDITQEVFLGAYRAIGQFAGRSEFFTWVYRIAVNRALNARRARRRRGETPIDDPRVSKAVAADAMDDPARAAELRETYSRLLQALDRLPPAMCTSVVLVALQGLSHSEASVVQGCSPGTIAWRIHKARGQLRRALLGGRGDLRPGLSRARSTRPAREGELSPELSSLLEQWGLPALAPG
jgi:RNA polymerase sigma-70 factor (ECF subfamily)